MVTKIKLQFKEKCQVCEIPHFETENRYYCEIHHLIPWSISHNDIKENLVVVCPTCHKKFDQAKNEIKINMFELSRKNYPELYFNSPSYIIPRKQ